MSKVLFPFLSYTFFYLFRLIGNAGGNYGGAGAMDIGKYATVTLTNSFFLSNVAETIGSGYPAAIRVLVRPTNPYVVTITGNSFYNNGYNGVGATIDCDSNANVVQSNNFFCGGQYSAQISCGSWSASSTSPDSCNVCNGNNAEKDCLGVCFGYAFTDSSTHCCDATSADCLRECNGTASYDPLGVCCAFASKNCSGYCGGSCITTQEYTTVHQVTTQQQQGTTTQQQTTQEVTTVQEFTTVLQITTVEVVTTQSTTSTPESTTSHQSISMANTRSVTSNLIAFLIFIVLFHII